MISRILPCIALLCFFILCNHLQLAAQAPPGLLGVEWVLLSFDNSDGSLDTTISSRNPTMYMANKLSPYDSTLKWKSVDGNTPCSGWSGGYQLFSPDSIAIISYGQNLINCPNKSWIALEDRWLASITHARHYELNGIYLHIHYLRPGIDTGTMNFIKRYPQVRYVNLITGISDPGIDLQVDWDTIPRLTGLPYRWVSPSFPLEFGPHAFRIQYGSPPNRITLSEGVTPAYPDSIYTVFAMGESMASVDQRILSERYRWNSDLSRDSVVVRLLVASHNLPIERVWMEDPVGNVIADFGTPHYGEASEFHSILSQPLRLYYTLRNDPTEYILTGKYSYSKPVTLILQQGKQSSISGLIMNYGTTQEQWPLDTLWPLPGGNGGVRVANPSVYPEVWRMPGDINDTLISGEATQLYPCHSGLVYLQTDSRDPVEVVPDSISTIVIGWYKGNLRTPLHTKTAPGETRLRFINTLIGSLDTLDLHVRYANGDTTLIRDLKRSAPSYTSVPSGTVIMDLYKRGESLPRLRAKGILHSAYLTAIVTGGFQYDSTADIYLLNETDTAAQKPMTMLERYSPDTTKGWFRTVNVMQGGAMLCSHFAGNDSTCLAYRRASHRYENYTGSTPQKIELEWNGRIPITPPAIRPDTLTTLFSLGRAGTHFMISKFLETPLKQPVPSGKAMLRVLNAAYGSELAYTRIVIDKDEFIDHIMFDEETIYRPVSAKTAKVSLYNSAGILLRETAGNIPAGTYGTLIITGSDDSLGVDLLIDSDSTGQAPLVHFGVTASIASTNSQLLSMEILPNPTTGSTTLTLDARREGIITLTIYNSQGKVMRKVMERLTTGVNTLSLDTTSLPGGIYSIVVHNNNDTDTVSGTARLVVIR